MSVVSDVRGPGTDGVFLPNDLGGGGDRERCQFSIEDLLAFGTFSRAKSLRYSGTHRSFHLKDAADVEEASEEEEASR